MKPRSSSFMLAALGCVAPAAATAQGGRVAFVTSEAESKVLVVDLGAEKVAKTLPTGKVPHASSSSSSTTATTS